MAEVTTYAPGTPAWADLATTDPHGARDFYGELFGWEFDVGPEESGRYTMCRLGGHNVAGMVGKPVENMPTAWTTYIATHDADVVAQRIGDHGGNVFMGPMDVLDQGRLVVATDPTGAVFGLWQAGEHVGATLVNVPGTVIWNELITRDLDAAQEFYSAVFGYEWAEEDTGEGGPRYRTFALEGRTVGGAMQLPGHEPPGVPSHWGVYFGVADTDAAVATVERLGGGVQLPPTESPYGRLAWVRDPQGGVFSVISARAD